MSVFARLYGMAGECTYTHLFGVVGAFFSLLCVCVRATTYESVFWAIRVYVLPSVYGSLNACVCGCVCACVCVCVCACVLVCQVVCNIRIIHQLAILYASI
eukprot:GHVQ01005838.1.p2 GENE.GHVQ01005838.1~~GHVQ01005838.1.p2  ORF type:complete len:101 (-),score=9.04 GHVQ01005838.1:291-593(-)